MPLVRADKNSEDELLERLKGVSGRRIESERRRRFLTQRQFALRARMSIRWLREIEGGNPVVKLDDHLRCAAVLNIAPSYFFLPLLYNAHGQTFPPELECSDLTDIERRCIAMIGRCRRASAQIRTVHRSNWSGDDWSPGR